MTGDWTLVGRVAVGGLLCFAIGYERELRGAAAGDRTFALVGLGSTVVAAVTAKTSPQALAGVITGVGFIGGGLVFHAGGGVKGVTTAATIFASAAIGLVAGTGHLVLASATAVIAVLVLELRYLPGLRWLDGRRFSHMMRDDAAPPR
jgi:putative Mg2+ transporter-C (MgtC) family protein